MCEISNNYILSNMVMMNHLFSYPGITFTKIYFKQTRDWHSCLDLVDYCLTIVDNNDVKANLILFKLEALYHLNYWQSYIKLYDETVANFRYSNMRTTSYIHIDKKFILQINQDIAIVHFLFLSYATYQKAVDKLSKLLKGSNTSHLECHSRTELTNEELKQRTDYLYRLFLFQCEQIKKDPHTD